VLLGLSSLLRDEHGETSRVAGVRVSDATAGIERRELTGAEEDPARSEDEEDFIMARIKSWDEGRAEVRAEERVANGANAVLTVFRVRGIAVPEADRQRILAQRDPAQLQRWLEKAILASSVAEVLDDPS